MAHRQLKQLGLVFSLFAKRWPMRSPLVFALSCFFVFSGLHWFCPVWSAEIHPYVQNTSHGHIDWFSGELMAQGICNGTSFENKDQMVQGLLFREARIQAVRHLWETVLEIRVDSESKVGTLVHRNQNLAADIRGRLHLARIFDRHLVDNDQMTVNIKTSLQVFSDIILPDSFWYQTNKIAEAPRVHRTRLGNGTFQLNVLQPFSKYSGLIIDARMAGGQPALSCKLLSPAGSLIYGPSQVIPEIAREKGMASYVEDLESAKNCERAGEYPLIIQAQDVRRKNTCDYVIVSEKTELLWTSLLNKDVFRQCRVVIVLGPSDPSQFIEYSLE
jgi:hypothetical protein